MVLPGSRNDDVRTAAFPLVLLVFNIVWMAGSYGTPTKDTKADILSAAACYGNVNNYLRLHCPEDQVIRVMKVIQGAKLTKTGCVTPATKMTYNRSCCHPDTTDCKIEVHDTVSSVCNGNTQCDVMAMWSMVSNQCDQDIYPITITYMQADYTCIQSLFSSRGNPDKTTGHPTTTNTTSMTTDGAGTTRAVVVVSTHDQDTSSSGIEMSDAIIGAILAGSLGMLLTFVVFIIYWRRKRKLRIIGKPQASVWDYLLNQTFTVRGERGYDHFSSCRSSASSDNGEAKSPVFRKTLWLPNISPVEDTQSDVFNDADTVHNLEFHQVGTRNPYAFLSLGVNNNNSNNSNNSIVIGDIHNSDVPSNNSTISNNHIIVDAGDDRQDYA